jgi:hypothetical protein
MGQHESTLSRKIPVQLKAVPEYTYERLLDSDCCLLFSGEANAHRVQVPDPQLHDYTAGLDAMSSFANNEPFMDFQNDHSFTAPGSLPENHMQPSIFNDTYGYPNTADIMSENLGSSNLSSYLLDVGPTALATGEKTLEVIIGFVSSSEDVDNR